MNLKKVFQAIILIAFTNILQAQLYNDIFKDSSYHGIKIKKTSLHLKALHYAQNSEYFETIAEGRTWLGYSVSPYLKYQINENISISGGLFLRKDHGKQNFSEFEPYFQMSLTKDHWALIFGNLQAAANHELIEPILNYESYMYQQTEHGIQIISKQKYFELDAWVDWNVAAFENEPMQEELTAGISSNLNLYQSKSKKYRLQLPVQSLIIHRGGQVNSPTDPLVTRHNTAIGLTQIINTSKNNIFKLFSHALFSYDNSGTLRRNYRDGYGIFSGINFRKKRLEIAYNYWYGQEYETENGLALYSSGSIHNLMAREQVRSLSSLRAVYNYPLLKNVRLDFRAGVHYNHLLNRIDHDAGLFMAIYL